MCCWLGTFQLFCCICVFIPTTVLNGQVLFAIFAIGIMFLCRFHKAREEYSGRNRCPNFLFFAAEASLVPSDISKLTKTCCVH